MSAAKDGLANPAPLGLCGFALTTWLLSLINNGTFGGNNLDLVLAMGMAFGGTAQMIAGMFEYKKGNTFGFTAFTSYGAFWWSFVIFKFLSAGKDNGVELPFVGWYLTVWGTFTLMMFMGTLAKARALQAIFLSLTITFYLLAAGDFTGNHGISNIGGNFGLLTALFAFYLAAADIINDSFGRTVLPIGEPK